MKKCQLISLTSYSTRTKKWTKDDILIAEVQKEDLFNHKYERIVIPKMNYPKSSLKESVGLLNFFKSNVESILP